MMSETGENEIR